MNTIVICKACGQRKPKSQFYKGFRECKLCNNARKVLAYRSKRALQRLAVLDARALRAAGVKRCPACKQTKLVSEFYKAGNSNFGVAPHCKLCAKQLYLRRRAKDKPKAHARYIASKYRLRNATLLRKFGITLEQYNTLLCAQGHVCAICGGIEPSGKALAVDHNHITGQVRGLLCGRCNPAIGFLRDDPVRAEQLAAYLRKNYGVSLNQKSV